MVDQFLLESNYLISSLRGVVNVRVSGYEVPESNSHQTCKTEVGSVQHSPALIIYHLYFDINRRKNVVYVTRENEFTIGF